MWGVHTPACGASLVLLSSRCHSACAHQNTTTAGRLSGRVGAGAPGWAAAPQTGPELDLHAARAAYYCCPAAKASVRAPIPYLRPSCTYTPSVVLQPASWTSAAPSMRHANGALLGPVSSGSKQAARSWHWPHQCRAYAAAPMHTNALVMQTRLCSGHNIHGHRWAPYPAVHASRAVGVFQLPLPLHPSAARPPAAGLQPPACSPALDVPSHGILNPISACTWQPSTNRRRNAGEEFSGWGTQRRHATAPSACCAAAECW